MRSSASPRWGNNALHGNSSSSQGPPPTSLRGTTAPGSSRRGGMPQAPSPRGSSTPSGSMMTTKFGSARDQHQGSRGTVHSAGMVADARERGVSGSGGRAPKAMGGVDGKEEKDDNREDSAGRIRVAVRVRPFSEKETLAGTRCVISMAANQTKILDPAYFDSEEVSTGSDDRSMWERTFSFDHSFWSHSPDDDTVGGGGAGNGGRNFSSQADVHQALGEFLLDNACRGFNCSLFAYGQTGSGKTYTMLGDSSDLATAAGEGTAGLIPRICVELFQRFGLVGGGETPTGGDVGGASRGKGQASVQVSFCEVRDLFCQRGGNGHGLRVREHPARGAFVEGLSARPVTCYQQVQHLLEDGMSARATAATAMNEVSSRSHAIFTIYITVTSATKLSSHGGREGGEKPGAGRGGKEAPEDDMSSRTSKICLVDLAGSERANATGAKGDRLREAANINKSLSTLGDVIKALAKRAESGRGSSGGGGGSNNSESFIPYRNSMLTWLLKDSIGGNSKTVMLAAISPLADAYQETMSTLRYVERAKEIVNTVAVNDANANPLVGRLKEEIRTLKEVVEKNEATIAEHEGKEEVLTEALERVRAVDSDKATRALEDAGHLEAALQAERKTHAEAAAVAIKEAADADMCSRQQIDALTKEKFEANLQNRQQIEALTKANIDADQQNRQQVDELTKSKVDSDLETSQQIDALTKANVDADLHHKQQIDALTQAHADADLQNKQQTEALTKAHVEVMENLSLRHHESAEVAKREAEAFLAEEVARVREHAAEEHRQWRSEREDAAEKERSNLAETHQVEMAAAAERHRAETQGIVERAASAAACVAESVATDMSNLRNKHAKELADTTVAAETTRVQQLRRLQDELDEERATALREAREARNDRRAAELKREGMFKDVTAKVEAAAKETGARAIDDLQKQFDVEFARLNDANGLAVKAAVGKTEERLREKHESAMAAAVSARESVLVERHLEEVKLSEERHSATEEAAVAALKAEHARQMTSLRGENAVAIAKIGNDADVRRTADLAAAADTAAASAAAAKAESLRCLEELEQSHHERTIAAEKRHEGRVSHAIEAEKMKGKAELAETASASTAAIESIKAETSAARAILENQYRDELATVREKHETEIKAVVTDAERRQKEAREDATQHQKAILAEARSEADRVVSLLNTKHTTDLADANHRFQTKLQTASSEAEQLRQADIGALEARTSASLADANDAAAAKLAEEKEKHQGQIRSMETEHKSEIEKVRLSMDAKRDEERAAAAEALSRALAEANAEHLASLAAVKSQSNAEMRSSLEAHRCEIERVANDTAEERAAYVATAKEHLLSSIAAIKAETASVAGAQDANNLEEKRKMEEGYVSEIDRIAAAAENRRVSDIGEVHEQHAKSLAEIEATAAASIFRLKLAHEAEVASLKRANTENEARILKDARESSASEIETLTKTFEEGKHAYEGQMDATLVTLESRRLEELTAVQEKNDAEIESIKKVAEEKIAAESAKMSDITVALIAEQTAKTVLLLEEHADRLAAVSEKAETRRVDDLDNAERRFRADLDAAKKGIAEEKAKFVTHHLLDLRKVKEEAAAEVKRVSAAAIDRSAAQEAENTAALSRVKADHLEELRAASSAAEEARKVERDGFENRIALTKSEKASVEDEMKQREEQHQCDLRRIDDEKKAEKSANVAAASERHDEALASALAEANIAAETLRTASLAAQEEKFADILQTERSSHAGSLSAAETLCATVKADAICENETLKSEHLLAVKTIENAHRTAVEELEEGHRTESNEMAKRVEGAEIAAVEAQASADELGTRAAALDEMLRASVGSKEQELAGHRSRVAQLQAFVARREAALQSSDKDGGADGNALSPAAARSVQQRVIDLRAMAAGAGAGGLRVGVGEAGLDAFASTGLVEGLTMEKYAEELEAVLVRATVESAAARQDHLESELQHQSVTRQLVGLKLVHAQLRECLEDTQVKLEHKSQSAARRLLNSAARLAYEFAKPDRSSASTAASKKALSKTTPKAMGRQGSGSEKSPATSDRGRRFGRSRSPPPEGYRPMEKADLSATL